MGGAHGQARDRVAAAAAAAGIWVPPPVDASLRLPLLLAHLHSRETLPRLLPRLQGLLQGEKPQLRHVCGVELSLRPQRDCLAVWNIKGGHSSFIKSMRAYIISTARLGATHKVNYLIIRGAAFNPPAREEPSALSSASMSSSPTASWTAARLCSSCGI